jgi:hypothetical protein
MPSFLPNIAALVPEKETKKKIAMSFGTKGKVHHQEQGSPKLPVHILGLLYHLDGASFAWKIVSPPSFLPINALVI